MLHCRQSLLLPHELPLQVEAWNALRCRVSSLDSSTILDLVLSTSMGTNQTKNLARNSTVRFQQRYGKMSASFAGDKTDVSHFDFCSGFQHRQTEATRYCTSINNYFEDDVLRPAQRLATKLSWWNNQP